MRITQFKGIIPKISDKSLPQGVATFARNLDLYGNRLRPIKLPAYTNEVLLDSCGRPFKGKPVSIHRAGSVYVAWDKTTFTAVDWTKKLGDTTFLFVEDGVLYRQSAERLLAKQCPIKVGIKRPNKTTITTTAVDQAGCEPTRIPFLCVPDEYCDNVPHPPVPVSYVFTYVNACGEESAHSEPSEVLDIEWGDAVHVQVADDTVPDNAVMRRWYRAVTDNEGVAHWLRVGETSIDTNEFYDMNCPCDFNDELETERHDAPPDCLEGIANIGDNMTIVWSNHRFWLSENNFPHAYDILNEYKLRYRILGMFEVTPTVEGEVHYDVMVITDGLHYGVKSEDPASVKIAEIQQRYKCINIDGASHMESAIMYPAKQGIIVLSQQGEELVTGTYMTEIEWAKYDPYHLKLTYHDDRIYGFNREGGFILQIGQDKRREGELVDHNIIVDTAFTDEVSPFVLFKGNKILEWGAGEFTEYNWKSQPYTMPGLWRPVAAKVVSPEFDNIVPRGHKKAKAAFEEWKRKSPNGSVSNFFLAHPEYQAHYAHLVGNRPSVAVIIYADGREYYRRQVVTNKPFLLPRKYKAIDWSVRVIGHIPIDEIHLQTSRESLLEGR